MLIVDSTNYGIRIASDYSVFQKVNKHQIDLEEPDLPKHFEELHYIQWDVVFSLIKLGMLLSSHLV